MHWAELLVRHAESAAMAREREYWAALAPPDLAPLPVDHDTGPNTVASMRTVTARLDSAETAVLLTHLPERFGTHMHETLLAALAKALAAWTGQRRTFIDVERHGRESLFDDVDLSRTVGWFTSIAPVPLDVGAGRTADEVLTSVKEQLRAIPNRGIGFGILRYLCSDLRTRRALQGLPAAQIGFNYLGQFGQTEPGEAWREEDTLDATGPARGSQNRRRHVLEINSHVLHGRFAADFHFSEHLHRRDTIERLAERFVDALREFAALGQATARRRYTASDFTRARLGQGDFAKLMEQLDALYGDQPT
jgi:non-ribosomal peptide synthase protein (TIGR01720 family)